MDNEKLIDTVAHEAWRLDTNATDLADCYSETTRIFAAIEAAGYMVVQGWRDIADAPRDGTWVVGWADSYPKPVPICWDDDTDDYGGGEVGWCYGNSYYGGTLYYGINLMKDQPTHFMPLPAAPNAGRG